MNTTFQNSLVAAPDSLVEAGAGGCRTHLALRSWVHRLISFGVVEYAEKKDPRERLMQSGQAWRGLVEVFGEPVEAWEREVFLALVRLARGEEPICWVVDWAMSAVETEDHGTTGLRDQGTKGPRDQQTAGVLRRFCGWLEAGIHLHTHGLWHLAPACFDFDPERRELAVLGTAQRHFAGLDEWVKQSWQQRFAEAAEQFKNSPKWAVVGRAMADGSDRLWLYREVDVRVIVLWPLATRHNWTYRDLLNVIRPALKRPEAYPCDGEQSFATYCNNVLGLRKSGRGRTAKDGKPVGYEVAVRILGMPGDIANRR